MSDSEYPTPVSDPESDGLPGVADDDSNAYDDVDPAEQPGSWGNSSGRQADGQSPAAFPGDEGNPRFGTTAAEERQGESLAQRLAQEEPDISADDPWSEPTGRVGRLVAPDEGGFDDDEPDSVAYDAGSAGGGASAEELAMHEISEDDDDRAF